mmetsp:Transcript_11731/g.30091  ORF Transcript_11731/g.30091 Transcript_11731/m.30091 type:complete len:202 (+) Transcript_11731:378-983(+)
MQKRRDSLPALAILLHGFDDALVLISCPHVTTSLMLQPYACILVSSLAHQPKISVAHGVVGAALEVGSQQGPPRPNPAHKVEDELILLTAPSLLNLAAQLAARVRGGGLVWEFARLRYRFQWCRDDRCCCACARRRACWRGGKTCWLSLLAWGKQGRGRGFWQRENGVCRWRHRLISRIPPRHRTWQSCGPGTGEGGFGRV